MTARRPSSTNHLNLTSEKQTKSPTVRAAGRPYLYSFFGLFQESIKWVGYPFYNYCLESTHTNLPLYLDTKKAAPTKRNGDC